MSFAVRALRHALEGDVSIRLEDFKGVLKVNARHYVHNIYKVIAPRPIFVTPHLTKHEVEALNHR